ncbi:MAG: 30S ribosomal protein S12 methylthiotransferase RimO [Dethiobacteria bacterium]|jgi:ribosomal protein S12 methylthiotransferase
MLKNMTFSFISLGCAKNLVDSEEIMGNLIREGCRLAPQIADSDFVVINTCAFLHEARREAFEIIKEMGKIKRSPKNKLSKIVVAGCLVQYFTPHEIKAKIPEADLFVPVKQYRLLPRLLESVFFPRIHTVKSPALPSNSRFLSRSPHSVYIKIADGCDNRCSYCLIPFLRGKLRSKSIDDIISEVHGVQKLGAREIILIAQDITAYGLDLYGKFMLGELLRRLCKIKDIKWIRLLYLHPAHITDDLLNVVQQEPKICKYLDLPIQHINNKILRLMGRKTSREEIIFLYNKVRALMPEVVLRTTVMTGFPGEGEEEFAELLTFLRKYPFERLGAFSFSPERGAAAFELPSRVKKETAVQRWRKIMEQQKVISRSFNRSLLGQEVEVLVDAYSRERKSARGRMISQAPEVDGQVIIGRASAVKPGDFLRVKITGVGTYDLMGEKMNL